MKNTTFVRSFTAQKGKHKISGVVQPYICGMYVAISDSKVSSLIQLSLKHKGFSSWIKRTIAGFVKEGYKVKTSAANLTNFISEEDQKEYAVKL